MKKKTLIILLSIVIAAMGLIVLKNIYYFIFNLSLFDVFSCSGNHTHVYYGFTLTCAEHRTVLFNQVITPFLTFVFDAAVEILLIVIMVAFVKREHLMLVNEDISKLEANKKTKKIVKKQKRIMQLNAELEKIKSKGD